MVTPRPRMAALAAFLLAGAWLIPEAPSGLVASWSAAHSNLTSVAGRMLHTATGSPPSVEAAQRLGFTLGTVAVMEAVFWSLNGMLALCYYLELFPRYRMRGASYPDRALVKECLQDILLGHFLIRPPLLHFVAWPIMRACGAGSPDPSGLPGFGGLVAQIFFCMCVDDTLFYFSHRLLHHPMLYKHIHKKHHKFRHTIGIAVEYAHPVEDLLSNALSTLAGPILLGGHLSVLWLYIGMKLWQSIEAHSGYNPPFPLSPFSMIEAMDCAPAHDFHHSHNCGNFGGYFVFWDWLLGTNYKYADHLDKHRHHTAYWNVLGA